MEGVVPMGGFQLPFQRRLSTLYNDTKKSSDFVKESAQSEHSPEMKALHRKLKIQKDRLASWGLEWSDPINPGFEIDESLSTAGLSEVVGSIMSTIKDILAEAEPLWQSSKHIQDQSRPMGDKKLPIVQWDKGRFEDLVRDLTLSIDTLYDVSRTRSSSMARRPSKPVAKATDEAKPFESSRRQVPQPIDPSSLEHIQSLRSPTSPNRSVVLMSKTAWSELMQSSSTRQSWAPLLLEYATFDPIYSTTGIMPDMARFEKLSAGLQQDPQRSPDAWTGLPNLVAYFEDMENSRLGLLYRFPNSFNTVSVDKMTQRSTYNLPSLQDLLEQPDSEPTIEAKFRLAHNLANTIFDIHTRGIPHGQLSSSNISFCAIGQKNQPSDQPVDEFDLRRPLLSSFDLFPEDMGTMPTSLTRHPQDPRCNTSSVLSRDTDERIFDLFSLATILLSVGLWQTLESLQPELSSGYISEALLRRLSIRCGTLYMKSVQICWAAVDDLIANPNTGDEILSEVQVKVSRYLEACCILDGVRGLESRLDKELHKAHSAPAKDSLRPMPAGPSTRDVKSAVAPVAGIFKDAQAPQGKTAEQTMPPPQAFPPPMLPARYDPTDFDAPVTPSQKSEVKMRLYPHVPLAPDVVAQWNTSLMPQINTALRGFYKKHPESVEISLESVGPSPTATKPTVVVVCTSVGKVRAILKKRLGDLFDSPGGVGLKVCRGQVVRSRRQNEDNRRSLGARRSGADDEDGKRIAATNPEYQEKPNNGASIGAWIGDRHLPPVSFGGLVMVDDKPYGMTVHHMLDDPDGSASAEETNRSMASKLLLPSEEDAESLADSDPSDDYGFELSDADSDYYSETDLTSDYDDSDSEDEFEPGDIPGVEPGCGDGYVVTQPALDDVKEGFFASPESEDEEHLDSHSLGTVYASSGIRRKETGGLLHEIDWALFEITPTRLPSENAIPQSSSDSQLRPTKIVPSASLPGTEVQCSARTSGLQTGTILPTLTSVKIYGRRSPSHTYQISSLPSPAADGGASSTLSGNHHMGIPGDSGAWIVSRTEGHLCGHVLAWSQRKHVAYICPMDVLFADIADALDATSVTLPLPDALGLVDTAQDAAATAYSESQDIDQIRDSDDATAATLRGPFSGGDGLEALSAVDLLALQMANLDKTFDKEMPPLAKDSPDNLDFPHFEGLGPCRQKRHEQTFESSQQERCGASTLHSGDALTRYERSSRAGEMTKLNSHLAGGGDAGGDNASVHSARTVRSPQGLGSGFESETSMLMHSARGSQMSSRSASARGSPRSAFGSPMIPSVSVA